MKKFYNKDMPENSNNDGVSIHAGFPNPATDKALGDLNLQHLLIQHPASTFFFRVSGEAWADTGVFDGDIAIIDRALDPRPSDLVLWWHDEAGEFALSRYKEMPAHAAVRGVVTATIHQLRSAS